MNKKDVDRILARIFENRSYDYVATIVMKNGDFFEHDKKDGKDKTKDYYIVYKNDSEYKHYIPYANISYITVRCIFTKEKEE